MHFLSSRTSSMCRDLGYKKSRDSSVSGFGLTSNTPQLFLRSDMVTLPSSGCTVQTDNLAWAVFCFVLIYCVYPQWETSAVHTELLQDRKPHLSEIKQLR